MIMMIIMIAMIVITIIMITSIRHHTAVIGVVKASSLAIVSSANQTFEIGIDWYFNNQYNLYNFWYIFLKPWPQL